MITAPYILGRNYEESHKFARVDLGLEPGTYRVVSSPATLSAVRGADLYLVPGWDSRYDRFAMQGALKWTRMNIIDVAEQELESEPEPVTNEEAHDFVINGDNMISEGGPVHPEPEPSVQGNSARRRRSRCKECGTLHFKGEACVTDPFPVE